MTRSEVAKEEKEQNGWQKELREEEVKNENEMVEEQQKTQMWLLMVPSSVSPTNLILDSLGNKNINNIIET